MEDLTIQSYWRPYHRIQHLIIVDSNVVQFYLYILVNIGFVTDCEVVEKVKEKWEAFRKKLPSFTNLASC